jgi:hypothetical protein
MALRGQHPLRGSFGRGFNNEVPTITFGDQSFRSILRINRVAINRYDLSEGLIAEQLITQ